MSVRTIGKNGRRIEEGKWELIDSAKQFTVEVSVGRMLHFKETKKCQNFIQNESKRYINKNIYTLKFKILIKI